MGANAARDRTYNAEELGRLLNRVEKAVADLEDQNEGGEDTPALHLPEELANKRVLREQIRHAMDELASEQNRKRINLTDWDARLMKTRQGFVPSYNAQAMVSPLASGGTTTGMLLTAVDVVDQTNDAFQLTPMMEQAEGVTGTRTPVTLADAGYCGGGHLEASHRKGQQVAMPDMARPLDNPYHKDRFTYDEDNDSYICPQGKEIALLQFVDKQRNAGPGIPTSLCLRLPQLPLFWSLHQGLPTGTQTRNRTIRPCTARSQRMDVYRGSQDGLQSEKAVDRTGLRNL